MLWSLFALLIPIVIHLFSLRKNRSIEFSSIQHIKAIKRESIRKIKLLQWIVMILRMGIIGALVMMASGPIIMNQSFWIPSEKESLAVIIVDNSASMSVKKNNKSFLEDSSDQIYKIISSFDGLVNLNVYQTSPPKLLFSGNIDKGMHSNYQEWDFKQSMGKDKIWTFTDSILKTYDSNLPNKECFIISDFPVIPPTNYQNEFVDWRFYFLGKDDLENNIAIKSISTSNKIKLANELIKLNTRIENMGVVERRNVPVEIYLNDERSGQIVSHFQPGKIKDFLFQVYPGKTGVIRGKIELPKDDYLLDNYKTFELNIPEQISCKVIATSQDDLLIIKTLLESISGPDDIFDIELKVKPEIDKIFLDNTDVLILQDPKAFSLESLEKIKRFISNGGSIVWFSGNNYESIDEVVKSKFNLPKYLSLVELEDESYFTVNIVDRENPILQELNFRNSESIFPQIFKFVDVRINNNQKAILSLNNDSPYLIEIPILGSQIYFFTSILDLRWNDFGMKGSLIPMMYRLLMFTVIDEFNTSSSFINEPKVIKVPNKLINNKWIVKMPSGSEIIVVPNYDKEQLVINNTNELGSYEVFANNEFYTAFSTKLSPFESPKIRVDKENLMSVVDSEKSVWINPDDDVVSILKSKRHGRSIWRTFLIIAILLFIAESIISRPKVGAIKN